MTVDSLDVCTVDDNSTENAEKVDSDQEKIEQDEKVKRWLLGVIVFVAVLILGTVLVFYVCKRRKSETNDQESIDINPDYGYDYGEAEIRDVNDYYFADDYEDIYDNKGMEEILEETKQL